MTEKEYRKLDLVSYSSLSKLASSPQAYKANLESKQKETSAMVLGSVVDIMLTDPKRFDGDVYVMTTGKPGSELMLKYCDTLAETGDSVQAYKDSGFKLNPSAVANKFDKEGKAYYEALLASKGKMIIDADDYFKANQIVETLMNNIFTKKYFTPDSEHIELRFQEVVQWVAHFVPLIDGEQKGEEMMKIKSMIDIIHINHKTGVITPVDLKTGAESFMKSYWKYRRYLQAAMYTDSLSLHPWGESTFGDNRIDHYTVAPMKFIYADTNLFNAPVIYTSTHQDISVGVDGLTYLVPVAGLAKSFKDEDIHVIDTIGFGPSSEFKIKGYRQLIAELDWHYKMDQWDYTYEDWQNMGERQIDAFGIKL